MTILAILAVLPAAVLLYVIYKADNVEKEPIGLMALVFFLGVLSTISAVILETIGENILDIAFRGDVTNPVHTFLLTFLVVGVAEEGGKYLVLKLLVWKNKEFNFSFDGIVYAVCSSLGFATLENILYVLPGGFHVGVTRALLSVPGHCIFGIFMGIYFGLAKGNELRGNVKAMKSNLIKAFWIPVVIHGFYDFCLMVEYEYFMLAFIALEIFMVTRAIKMVKLMSKTDSPLIPGVSAQEAINIRNMQAMREAMPTQMQGMAMQPNMAMNMQQPQYMAQNMQQPYMQNAAQGMQQPQYAAQGMQQPQYMAQNMQQPQYAAQNMQSQYVAQNMQQPQYTAQNVQQPVMQNAAPAQNANTASTEELFNQDPAIMIQNEPLVDGLSNPNPVFTAEDLT